MTDRKVEVLLWALALSGIVTFLACLCALL